MSSESPPKIPAYYIGAKAIAQRLGYKSPRVVDHFVKRDGLLVHKRTLRHRTGCYKSLAISEAMIQLWEVARGLEYRRERLRRTEKEVHRWVKRLAG